MSETKQTKDEPCCAICHKPLVLDFWIDDDEYGDVHIKCLEAQS